MAKKTIMLKIHNVEEFDKEMLNKALKILEGKEELIDIKEAMKNIEKEK